MAEWDEKNRPKYYIPGVSPGFSRYMQGEEKLSYQGFARKLMKAARFGFEFAMIDYEEISEMFEPGIEKLMEQVRTTEGIEFGLHLPINLDPSIADASMWYDSHDMFIRGAYAGRMLKAKFIHTHSSNKIEPALTFKMGGREFPTRVVVFDGTPLGQFLKEVDEGKFVDDWFKYMGKSQRKPKIKMSGWFKAKYFKLMFQGVAVSPEPLIAMYEFETYEEAFEVYNRMISKALELIKEEILSGISSKMEELEGEVKRLGKDLEKVEGEGEEAEKKKAEIEGKIRVLKQKIEVLMLLKEYVGKLKHDGKTDKEFASFLTDKLKDIGNTIQQIAEQVQDIISIPPLELKMKEKIEEVARRMRDKLAYSPSQYFILMLRLAHHIASYSTDAWFDQWVNNGSEAQEAVAYRAVAKYMYLTRDPIWLEMVEEPYGMEIDPDVVIDFENNVEPLVKVWRNRYGKGRLIDFLKKVDRRRLMKRIVAAVCAKYIQGHLFSRKPGRRMGDVSFLIGDVKLDEKEKEMSVYEFCARHKIRIYFENGFSREQGVNADGRIRMMHMDDHCRMVHAIDRGEWVGYCPDFEHIVVNLIDPAKDISEIKDGYARYITEIHINAPRPLNATHAPINLLSTDTEEIYKWLYALWKKGMKAAYFIWEMGSYGVRQTALVFRKWKEELDKPLKGLGEPTPPDKLPPEFFGIDEKLEAATQLAIIEHGLDPLEGLLLVPEEKHGFLGRAAKDKQKLGEWAMEELW